MGKYNVKNLDEGQLDLMFSFLQFKGKDLSICDIESLEKNLDWIRQAMIQKTGGQKQYGDNDSVDITDLGTIMNTIIVQAMSIYLCGGFDILKKYCEEDNYDI